MPKDIPVFSLCAVALLAGAMLLPAGAAAQRDSVTVVAGPQYSASGAQRTLLGDDYRDLWTTPVRVAVLDPATFAGGLTAGEVGGGKQTISLRLRGADGREYVFRSVDKDQTGGLPEDFQETLVDRVVQDQVSSKHPAAALIAAPLLEAAGVLHARPLLFVMPDHPFLGEHRETFAGMLGTLEVRPNEREEGNGGFAGAVRVVGTETVLENLEERPEHRADSRAFLRARLMDFLIGDWDRHMDQWRWARFDRDGVHWWEPIPRDRDNALSRFDGLLMRAVRQGAPTLVEFGPRYPRIYGLTANAAPLDRRLLSELDSAAFQSMAAELQRLVTNEVIDAAVTSAPPEYHALRGAELAGQLRARRDRLPEIAREFYTQLADQVDVRGTDAADRALVDRLPDGAVEVRLAAAEAGAEPYFQRRFLPGDTREIRIFLHGGDDVALVRGEAKRSIRVRIVGGGGNDVLVDSSRVGGRGRRTALYDHRGENRLEPGTEAGVDTREYEDPNPPPEEWTNNVPPLREWGSERQWLHPHAEWRYNVGPVVGGGPRYTRYGFRQNPYAYRIGGRLLYAPLETRFGVQLEGDFRRVNSRSRLRAIARASQLEVARFHGFGNETENEGSAARFKVWQTEYRLEPLYLAGIGENAALLVGPVIQYTDPELPEGSPAAVERPFGSDPFGQAGAQLGLRVDTRDLPSFPRRGLLAEVRGSAFPEAWDVPRAFGRTEATASSYLPVPLPLESTLALRVGGRAAWGGFPFQEAAFVGGLETLRGYARQRFAGDAALFGGAELRTFLTRFNFISRGDLGVIALADAGRVWVDGESPGAWHTGVGGGLWIGILDRTRTFSLVYAHGEEGALYFSFGVPF
jgi:hypothetical protein